MNVDPRIEKMEELGDNFIITSREETATLIDGIAATMEQPGDNARLTEYHFVTTYLDLFKKIAENPNDKSYKNDPIFLSWITASGGGNKEVYVVDNNDHDRILYKVPALFAYSNVNYDIIRDYARLAKTELAEVASRYIMLTNHTPETGENFIHNITKSFNKATGTAKEEIRMRWASIFARYKNGYNPNTGNPIQTEPKSTTTSSSNHMDFSTDDLWG